MNRALNAAYPRIIGKDVIARILDFSWTKISFFEADAAATKRFREEFTPAPAKTSAIEQAEQCCPVRDDTKRCIKNKLPVPQDLLQQNNTLCSVVTRYYTRVVTLQQIGKMYVVTEQFAAEPSKENTQPPILGVISIPQLPPSQAPSPQAWLNHIATPITEGTVDDEVLRTLPTSVKEQSTQDSHGNSYGVRGSILHTPHRTMYDYLAAALQYSSGDKIWILRYREPYHEPHREPYVYNIEGLKRIIAEEQKSR